MSNYEGEFPQNSIANSSFEDQLRLTEYGAAILFEQWIMGLIA